MNLSTRSIINIFVLILFGFALGMTTSNLRFQQRGPRGFDGGPGPQNDKRAQQEKMVELLTKQLDLSKEQQDQVKSIIASGGERLKALHLKTFPKFEEIRRDVQSKLREVMVGEQVDKFDKFNKDMKQGRRPPRPQRPPRRPPPRFN